MPESELISSQTSLSSHTQGVTRFHNIYCSPILPPPPGEFPFERAY